MLVQVLMDINQNHLGAALKRVDALLALKPDFRLAQLIKGDLLLAHARPIGTMGAADAPAERLNDLRDERAHASPATPCSRPRTSYPSICLQLQPQQHYAVVVDTAKSTLYLFENQNGTPRYLTDYYITVGRNGINKLREGDKRTPLGVYHVTSQLPRDKLEPFYGAGAFPISYPNEFDVREGRNGHGSWLHGTPRDTYSRPPRASDGCVVLANEDLDDLAKRYRSGLLRSSSPRASVGSSAAMQMLRAGLGNRLEHWRRDWESRNTDQYLKELCRFRHRGYEPDRVVVSETARECLKEWIKVGLSDVSVFLYRPRRSRRGWFLAGLQRISPTR
jgi:hypothetical protein